ncbi:nucleoside hydrolase [Novosphingobium aquae]|uniref:Nucleoside hydrolase n=1 Tax=Novosphingobium aquae TaxID=3133435 RepID=A0ABU8S7P4_9SPHN
MIWSRRGAVGAGIAAALATGARLSAAAPRMIPQKVGARVIVDNDFAGDPDGLVALAHQLLAPRSHVVLVTSSFLSSEFKDPAKIEGQTARQGYDIALETISRLKLPHPVPVVGGAEGPVSPTREPSVAAYAIVAEAMRDHSLPLIFTCGGPLTNLAEALRQEPKIATRMKVIWIGGGGYPDGGWEYNLAMDAEAAREVIERSKVPLWQVPQPAYRQMGYSIAEMAADLRPISPFTEWLYDRFTTPPDFVELGGVWPMGDSPLVLLSAITSETSQSHEIPARRIGKDLRYGEAIPGRTIRVFDVLDARTTHADFLARLRLHSAAKVK